MSEHKYQKICRLSRCHKTFGTNLSWQEFCHPSHRIEFHQKEEKDQRILSNRVKALEEEILKKRR